MRRQTPRSVTLTLGPNRAWDGFTAGQYLAVGVEIDSVWDLVNTAEPYPAALPVLMEHLERDGYPDRVMESLGRALAVKPSGLLGR